MLIPIDVRLPGRPFEYLGLAMALWLPSAVFACFQDGLRKVRYARVSFYADGPGFGTNPHKGQRQRM